MFLASCKPSPPERSLETTAFLGGFIWRFLLKSDFSRYPTVLDIPLEPSRVMRSGFRFLANTQSQTSEPANQVAEIGNADYLFNLPGPNSLT